jgi:hypothetical protein
MHKIAGVEKATAAASPASCACRLTALISTGIEPFLTKLKALLRKAAAHIYVHRISTYSDLLVPGHAPTTPRGARQKGSGAISRLPTRPVRRCPD